MKSSFRDIHGAVLIAADVLLRVRGSTWNSLDTKIPVIN